MKNNKLSYFASVIKRYNKAISNTFDDTTVQCSFKNSKEQFSRSDKSNSYWNYKSICVAILLRTSLCSADVISKLLNLNIITSYLTSSSFRLARKNINPWVFYYAMFNANSAIIDKNKAILRGYPFVKAKRFRNVKYGDKKILVAVDGTSFPISKHPDTIAFFGGQINQSDDIVPMVRVSILYNISSGLILDVIIAPYTTKKTHGKNCVCERALLTSHLKTLVQYGFKPSDVIIVGDRGYPSEEIFRDLDKYGFHYIIRCPSDFSGIISKANKPDQIVTIPGKRAYRGGPAQKELKLRIICIILDSGEVEKLVTNIFDKTADLEYFKKVYWARWDLEVAIKFIKSVFGKDGLKFTKKESVNTIFQIIYAVVLNHNITALSKLHKDAEIELKEKTKRRIHEAKANVSLLFNRTRDAIISSIYNGKPSILLKSIIAAGVNSDMMVSIREGRCPDRYSYRRVKSLKQKGKTVQTYPHSKQPA